MRTWPIITYVAWVGVLNSLPVLAAEPETIPSPQTMLLRNPVILDQLALNTNQRQQVTALVNQIDTPLWHLRDFPPPERQPKVLRLLGELDQGLGKILTPGQQGTYKQLTILARGESTPSSLQINWSQVYSRACPAPELRGVSAWINSSPQTLAKQQGKVVLLHFFTSDCINCVNNLPQYNRWYSNYDSQRVAMIGIHRPEFSHERSLDHVRQKLQEHSITYPVAVDNDSQNWEAWGNRVWPSIYLIDKAGFVRYWWYGELNYAGRQGDTWIRTRVNQLLQEPN